MTEETCVGCGAVIPEGRQVCPNCEGKKLTDEIIKKAVEMTAFSGRRYSFEEWDKCKTVSQSHVLDLINRLQAENAELREMCSKSSYKDSWKNKFFKAQEEVERLTEERENMQAVIFALEEDKRMLRKQVDELKEEKTCVYYECNDGDWHYWECSNCGDAFNFSNEFTPEENHYYYCPNCGARITEYKELQE